MMRFLCSLWWVLSAACVLTSNLWAEPPQPQRPSDPPSIEHASPAADPDLPDPDLPDPAQPGPRETLGIPPQLQQPLPPVPQPDADARRRFDEAVQRRIQQALESGDATPTGDPILDGTLNAIRRQGSVLQDWPADQALFSTPAPPQTSPPASSLQPSGLADEVYYHTAEALLRSARLLSQLPGQDVTRQRLIQQLRHEAVRCLTDNRGEAAPYGSPRLPSP